MGIKKYTDFEKNENINQNLNYNIKEDLLINSDNNINSGIEILEENIIKFNKGSLNDILNSIKEKYSDIDYYFRKKDNELHLVKYNENLKINRNEFVNSLLKFYSSNQQLKKLVEGIKVKGNQNFCIIENTKFDKRIVEDLTKLLKKLK